MGDKLRYQKVFQSLSHGGSRFSATGDRSTKFHHLPPRSRRSDASQVAEVSRARPVNDKGIGIERMELDF